jgi:hypothetical protein
MNARTAARASSAAVRAIPAARAPAAARTAAAVLAALSLAGCPHGAGAPVRSGPEDAVHAYVAAVRAGDAARAWALLTPAARAKLTRADLEALLKNDREELLLRADEMDTHAAAGLPEHADVPLTTGGSVRLLREKDGWHVDESALSEAPPSSPEACLRSLVRALEAGRLEPVVGLFSTHLRAEFDAELALVIESLRVAIAAGVEPRGDRARVALDRGRALVLVREGGLWRVDRVEGLADGAPAPAAGDAAPGP